MKKLALVLLLLGVAACSGLGGTPSTPTPTASSCTTLGQVTYVRDRMVDVYFWYRNVPSLDVASFAAPETYLEAARYKPLDTTFSYINSLAADQALFAESQFIGIGVGTLRTSETEYRLTEAYPGSPAAEAGLQRGDYLLVINGKSVPDLLRTGEIATIFGPSQTGVTVDLVWRRPGGGEFRATLVKRAVTIPPVSDTRVFAVGGARVGYVFFRSFVEPSVEALNTAFNALGAAGANELILDLRYNGGGLVTVMQHLAGLIAGRRFEGQLFVEFAFNDRYTSQNQTQRFTRPAAALDLSRLVVITTRSSASASESAINGLRPYMPVTIVGDRTYGKPVGQSRFQFCEKVLYPVTFAVRNTRGEADFYGGLPVDCAAGDDLDHVIGDSREASLAEAINYVRAGSCSGRAAAAAQLLALHRARIAPPPVDGWQELVGAY